MAAIADFSLDLEDIFNDFSTENQGLSTSNRFSIATAQNLEDLREKSRNKNTKKSTQTWLKVFDAWRNERGEPRKLEEIPAEELDGVLCRFFVEIRKQDGNEYEPDSLAVMQSSLDRHLKFAGKTYSILRDRQFARSRDMLNAKAKDLREKGYGKKLNASNALSADDEEFLWSSGYLGKHSAEALTNVNFKNLTEHFGLRGRQEHYSMQIEDFSIYTSPDNSIKYMTFKEGPTKTRSGGLRVKQRAVKPKMFATGHPLRCPVMLFEEMIMR